MITDPGMGPSVHRSACRAQRWLSRWSGPRPKRLSKEMSTVHSVFHKKVKLRPAYSCLLQSFPTQERCWNNWTKYTSYWHKLLWLFIHSVDHQAECFFGPREHSGEHSPQSQITKPSVSWSIPSPTTVLPECSPVKLPQGPLWRARSRPSGKYPRPHVLASNKGSNLISTQSSPLSHLSSCCICWCIFNK